MSKSQSATEFMLLIAAILIIFIPVFYLLTDYSITTGSELTTSRIRQIATKLVDESRETYYLGLFSREVVSVTMPDGITNLNTYIIEKGRPLTDEFYLNVSYRKGNLEITVPLMSEVPLITTSCNPPVIDCQAGMNCTSCTFDRKDYAAGAKNFRLETVAWNNRLAVQISPVYI